MRPTVEQLEARRMLAAAVSVGDTAVIEGSGGSQVLLLPVTLSEPSPTPVTIQYETVDGEAVGGDSLSGGVDYVALSNQTLRFEAGESGEKNIPIQVNPDTDLEGDESFQVKFISVVGDVTIINAAATGTIENDDANNDFVEMFKGVSVDDIVNGIGNTLTTITDGVSAAVAEASDLPVIGSQIETAIQPLLDQFSEAQQDLEVQIREIFAPPGDNVMEEFQGALFDVLGPSGLQVLKDSPDGGNDITADDIRLTFGVDKDDLGNPIPDTEWLQFDLHVGQRQIIDLPFELNLDPEFAPILDQIGLSVGANDGVRFDFRWDLRLGIGVSEEYGRQLGDYFYLNAGALDVTGSGVEEFRASIEITSAPPKDTNGNDTLATDPGIQADATFGLLATHVEDGIPFAVDVTAPNGIQEVFGNFDGDFVLVIQDDVEQETFEFPISYRSSGDETYGEFLVNLNVAVSEKLAEPGSPYEGRLPAVSVSTDFGRINGFTNPDAPTTPSMTFHARYPEISSMSIIDGGEYGFKEDPNHGLPSGNPYVGGQSDDGRSTALGFGFDQESVGDNFAQTLAATDLAPAGGLLMQDTKFFLIFNDGTADEQRVLINIGEEINRNSESLNDFAIVTEADGTQRLSEKSLEGLVREAVNTAVTQQAPAGVSLRPVDVQVVDGKFAFKTSGDDNDPAATMKVQYSPSDTSSLSVVFTVDFTDPDYVPIRKDVNNQLTLNRVTKQDLDNK